MPHPSITAETYPHKPAIIMGESGDMVTYRQLDERSNQGAQLFRSLGLKTGDHIGLMMENNREFLEIIWAAQRSGLVFHADQYTPEKRRGGVHPAKLRSQAVYRLAGSWPKWPSRLLSPRAPAVAALLHGGRHQAGF